MTENIFHVEWEELISNITICLKTGKELTNEDLTSQILSEMLRL